MLYRFDAFELDVNQIELRLSGTVVPVERQVFALLRLLVENRDRVVSKDEVVEKVWRGRVISDAAISSRVKSARRILGDDGRGSGSSAPCTARVFASSPTSGSTLRNGSSTQPLRLSWRIRPDRPTRTGRRSRSSPSGSPRCHPCTLPPARRSPTI
nr:winged helix-turn-helix domain-containing protein [Methylobacterium durans]